MAWITLIIAGALEVFWAYFMKLSQGFTKPLYSVITLVGLGIIAFKEPMTAGRMIFASLLLFGIIGLKLTSA